MDAIDHALQWKKAKEAKENLPPYSIESQALDVVISYERMRGWIEVGHLALQASNPFTILCEELSKVMTGSDEDSLQRFALKIILVAQAETMGINYSIEDFEEMFNLN
ncbi:hypothetical protein M3231_12040 [Neobacillus mesonae]|nr:hypothetical protein [Neobacillus mesonae]